MDAATIQAMKGSATPMASMFAAEEAQKAAVRVHDKIAEYQLELQKLRGFASENTSLVNSVERLPNELHHDIMVPFGKAAFFPGRLIHTNEFLVLLGEGYYAERTSRQTMEILKRRGKVLDEQVNSIKASMRDLEAEASFFNSTATEAEEGITDIIEDYVSETESESGPDTDSKKVAVDDGEEFERIMAKFEELEREELAAGSQSESDEDAETDANQFPDESLTDSISSYIKGVQLGKPAEESQAEHTTIMEPMNMDDTRQLPADQLNFEGLTVRSLPRDADLHEKSSSHNLKKPRPEKVVISPVTEEQNAPVEPSTKNEVPRQTSRPPSDNSKAFTGSIVERSHNLQTNPRQQSTASSQSESQASKPVSRFKMQRR